jgi:hypothetical protein
MISGLTDPLLTSNVERSLGRSVTINRIMCTRYIKNKYLMARVYAVVVFEKQIYLILVLI